MWIIKLLCDELIPIHHGSPHRYSRFFYTPHCSGDIQCGQTPTLCRLCLGFPFDSMTFLTFYSHRVNYVLPTGIEPVHSGLQPDALPIKLQKRSDEDML